MPLQKMRLNFMKLVAGSNHSNGGYISLAVSQAPMISAPRRKTTMPQISGSRFHLKGSHTFFSFPHIKIFPDNLVKVHFLIKVLHYRRNDPYACMQCFCCFEMHGKLQFCLRISITLNTFLRQQYDFKEE